MSNGDNSAFKEADIGLGAVEKVVKLLKPLLGMAIPDFKEAARGFEEICKRLLDANESLARWITKFRDFDFTEPEADRKFLELAGEYEALKSGRRYQELKFDCGKIAEVYYGQVRGKIKDLFSGKKLGEAEEIFSQLTTADADLVRFVHMVVFESLDRICQQTKLSVEKGDFAGAEMERLHFKVESADFYGRIQDIGTQLADLVLKFQRLASSGPAR